MDIVETAMQALNLYAAVSEKIEKAADKAGCRIIWTLAEDPKTLCDNGEDYQKVAEGIKPEKID